MENLGNGNIENSEVQSKKLSAMEVAKILEEITKDARIDEVDNPNLQKLLQEYASIREEHKKFLKESLMTVLDRGYSVKGKESYEIISKLFKKTTGFDAPKYEDIIAKNKNYSDFVFSFDGKVMTFYESKSGTVIGDFITYGNPFGRIDLASGEKNIGESSFIYIENNTGNDNTISRKYKISIDDLKHEFSETTDELSKKEIELKIAMIEKENAENNLKLYENKINGGNGNFMNIPGALNIVENQTGLPQTFAKKNLTYKEAKAKVEELNIKIGKLNSEIALLRQQKSTKIEMQTAGNETSKPEQQAQATVNEISKSEQQNQTSENQKSKPEQQVQTTGNQTSKPEQQSQTVENQKDIDINSILEGLIKGEKFTYKDFRGKQNEARVKSLQTVLNKILNINLEIDGKFGQKTYEAVMDFQKNNGLMVDGRVGKDTLTKIFENSIYQTAFVKKEGQKNT